MPEALGIPGGVWTETGKVFLDGETGRPESSQPYLHRRVCLMAAEGLPLRQDRAPAGFAPFYGKFESSDFSGLDPINPGSPLDFFNVASTPEDLTVLKVKRSRTLASLIAMLGVFVQGAVTRRPRQLGQARRRPLRLQLRHHPAVERTPVL